MTIRIHPFNTGSILLDKGSYVTPGRDCGKQILVPCNAFLVTDGRERILVDTGMCETPRADWHHPGSFQPEGFRIDRRLRDLGVRPEEIDAVILTHLHWDHCSNLKLFPRARFYVHERELTFARDPHVLYHKSYESPRLGVEPPFAGVEFHTVRGEERYNEHITMFPTPGHCPGHQSVAVEIGPETYVIAGDAVFADENLLPDKHRGLPFTPMARYVDVFQMFDSMARIVDRADVVLTGHGEAVFRQASYPPAA
jgi:glyoxylase-like metal-dependent hydrolase (beta-lactamase superfamily II)